MNSLKNGFHAKVLLAINIVSLNKGTMLTSSNTALPKNTNTDGGLGPSMPVPLRDLSLTHITTHTVDWCYMVFAFVVKVYREDDILILLAG